MPVPASVRPLEGGFALGDALCIAVLGPPSERVERALQRLVSRCATRAETARFEDVLQPDSRIGAAFGDAVASALASPSEPKRRALEGQLRRGRGNHDEVL